MNDNIIKYNPPDQHYIQLDIVFATAYGVNEALLFAKLHRLQERLTGQVDEAGNKWIRLMLTEWEDELPFLKEMTLRRTIESCEEQKLILSRTFTGRCKWYRVNPVYVSVQNEQLQVCKMNSPNVQNEQLPRVLPNSYPNTLSPEKNKFGEPPIQAKFERGKPHVDPLAHIVTLSQNGVSEATAPNPASQWLVYRDEMMKVYADFLGHALDRQQKSDIAAYIDEYPNDNASFFEKMLTECRHNWTGSSRVPWARILEVRAAGGTWAAWKQQTFKDKQKGQQTNGQCTNSSSNGTKLTPTQQEAYQRLEQGRT